MPISLPTLALFAASAWADDLVFSDLSLSADGGVTLRYALSPASAQAVADVSRMGTFPVLVVQFAAGGMDRTTHVELEEPSRTVTLADGSWPPGMTATVGLRPVGKLDRLRAPQGSGTSIRVRVDGGTPGALPLGIPPQQGTNTSQGGSTFRVAPVQPAPSVDPGSVDPAAVLAAAQQAANAAALAAEQRRIAEEQRRIAEERARARALVQSILDDPAHPLHAACATSLQGGLLEDCVNIGAFRDDGVGEVAACMQLDEQAFRVQCFESLKKRRYVATAAIGGCIEAFGTGEDGLRCTNAVVESPDDPAGDVLACGSAFEEAEDRMRCLGRFRERPGDASGVISACTAAFEAKDAHECFALVAEEGPGADGIAACGETFEGKTALECLVRLRPVAGPAAALVPVCAGLFDEDKDRLQCLERAVRDPDPERISACGSEAAKRRLRCVEGG